MYMIITDNAERYESAIETTDCRCIVLVQYGELVEYFLAGDRFVGVPLPAYWRDLVAAL